MKNDKPSRKVIQLMEELGLKYKVATDSIYTDKRDVPIHYFQQADADGSKNVSTIIAEDAVNIWRKVEILDTFGRHCKKCGALLKPMKTMEEGKA